MATASDKAVLVNDDIPKVKVAEVSSKNIEGEEIPGIDPFVAYEHAYRRKKRGEDLDYEVTDNGGIKIFYNRDHPDSNGWQEAWSFSITIEVLDNKYGENDSKDSYVEVRYDPKVENHNDGDKIWRNIVDRLEEKTEEYHHGVKAAQ